jgi:hypothetical protein
MIAHVRALKRAAQSHNRTRGHVVQLLGRGLRERHLVVQGLFADTETLTKHPTTSIGFSLRYTEAMAPSIAQYGTSPTALRSQATSTAPAYGCVTAAHKALTFLARPKTHNIIRIRRETPTI